MKLKTIFNPLHERLQRDLLPRYHGLQLSEQRMLILAAIILPLSVLIFAIMLPLHDRQLELNVEHQSLQQQLSEAEQLADRLSTSGAGQGSRTAESSSVMSLVEQLAREFSLRQYMTRIRPQPSLQGGNQRLVLQMKDAPYAACLKMLDAMARRGFQVISVRLQAGQSEGLVQLQMVIEKV